MADFPGYPIKYRHIREGYGGTFHFPKKKSDPPQLPHIGTTGCTTTIGIYLPIDKTRCFVAHINAFVKVRTNSTDRDFNKVEQDIREEEATFISEQVLQKLKDCAQRDKWTPKSVIDYSRSTGVNPKIVCAEVFSAPARPARFVGGAVSTFLGIHASDRLGEQSKGMVVEHQTGQVQYVFSSVEEGDEKRLFERVKEETAVQEWEIVAWRQEVARR